MRLAQTLALKALALAAAWLGMGLAYAPAQPPPSKAQRQQIDALAHAYTSKKCTGNPHDYLWGTFQETPPYPASQIPQRQAEYLAQAQAVLEGWSGKILSSQLKNYGSFVRVHNLIRYSNGQESYLNYELLTFHVAGGKVTSRVYASCLIQ